jgi:hypothetical protein
MSISKIIFKRDTRGEPTLVLITEAGEDRITDTFLLTEELYDQWVPDTIYHEPKEHHQD